MTSSVLCSCFIQLHSLMEHTICCVIIISRSWITLLKIIKYKKTNRIKPTYTLSMHLNLGPLHTRDWVPVTIALRALLLVEKMEPVQVHSTLCSRDQLNMWVQNGCKVYMDSYMASNGSSFMVTWTSYENHLLEIGLTQNRETMALGTLITVDLFNFIMCENPHD